MRRDVVAGVGLTLLGVVQMFGDIAGLPGMKGIGAATGASPAPKVFSSARGLETYSTRFELRWTGRDAAEHSLVLTPDVYARLRGPYNRRNVYGAVLAYGPVLATTPTARPMLDAVLRRALCGDAPLLRELGVDVADVVPPVRIVYTPLAGTDMKDLPRSLEAPCDAAIDRR